MCVFFFKESFKAGTLWTKTILLTLEPYILRAYIPKKKEIIVHSENALNVLNDIILNINILNNKINY